jgi:sigma-54 dependent transcriptional regulator, acetoin dehydrogenase operon transcriptional activator AcoR
MTDKSTGAMQEFGGTNPGEGPVAGLVLLYAEAFARLPAAFPLETERLLIGREPPADILLDVPAVSRRHAEIGWANGAFHVRDLGSRNGVLVNGRRVRGAELEPNDELRIGDAILKFVDRDAELYARYRIDGSMLANAERKAQKPSLLVGGLQMDRIVAEIERVAKAPLSVVLHGASGTGKEVVASELHRLSARTGRFCAINCAAIPAQLLESELFGFKRGAFSGADRDKPGLIRTADEGTLLLDEIGDMPLEAQAKLLRVLQAKEVFPLGATVPERVDVRVVCATHRDLERLQREGKFREDLFGRLNEYELFLPPLHERKEDVYMLARSFLARSGKPSAVLSFPFMTGLLHYDFPYNVRELEGCMKRCVALADDPAFGSDLLPEPVRDAMSDYGRSSSDAPPAPRAADALSLHATPTEAELRSRLAAHQGNVAAVGRELGKARMQIHRWMKRYGIALDEYRGPGA